MWSCRSCDTKKKLKQESIIAKTKISQVKLNVLLINKLSNNHIICIDE